MPLRSRVPSPPPRRRHGVPRRACRTRPVPSSWLPRAWRSPRRGLQRLHPSPSADRRCAPPPRLPSRTPRCLPSPCRLPRRAPSLPCRAAPVRRHACSSLPRWLPWRRRTPSWLPRAWRSPRQGPAVPGRRRPVPSSPACRMTMCPVAPRHSRTAPARALWSPSSPRRSRSPFRLVPARERRSPA